MKIRVESISPTGISVTNGSADELSFLEVSEVKRTNFADGVKDDNLIISLSDICVSEIEIDSLTEIDFFVQINKPVIEMMFFISSKSTFYLNDVKNPISIENNQHNIFYNPQDGYRSIWEAGKGQKVITITLYPDVFIKYLDAKLFHKFLKAIEQHKNAVLFNQNLTITPRMYVLLDEIVKNQHVHGARRLYIENCIYELMFLQIEQFSNLKKTNITRIPNNIEKKIVEAKELIDQNLSSPYSILNLAKEVGINDYHLKKGFKELYNNTVYLYTTQKRMEKAKHLLLKQDLNVNEVAYMLGYNDATNFSAAFKKFYGYTPGKIIRNK